MKRLIFGTLISLQLWANPCHEDQLRFCQNVDPGKGQLMKCLEDHQSALQPACQAELTSFKTKMTQKNPCYMDLAEWCKNVPSVEEKINICLFKHENRLTTKCAEDFKKKKNQLMTNNPCMEDSSLHCYDKISMEDGFVGRCLIKNVSKLKPNCQVKIKKQIADYKIKNVCFDDTEKFCPDMVRIYDIDYCLGQNLGKLQPQCQKRVAREIKLTKEVPCYVDLKKFCKPSLASGESHRCLTLYQEELSPECKKAREKEQNLISERMKACKLDQEKFCKDVPHQEGKVLQCLRNQKSKLSLACQKVI